LVTSNGMSSFLASFSRSDLTCFSIGTPWSINSNDSHYVTEDQADAHDSLLCVGVGRNKDDPNRFRFNGYLNTSS
jgi:hypothetical protein